MTHHMRSLLLTMLFFKTLQLDLVCFMLCLPLEPTNLRCIFVLLAWRQRKVRQRTRRCIDDGCQSLEFVADLKQTARICIRINIRPISLSLRMFHRRPRSDVCHRIVETRKYVRIGGGGKETACCSLTLWTF